MEIHYVGYMDASEGSMIFLSDHIELDWDVSG